MSTPQTLPYGSWPSPITAQDIAQGTTSLSFPGFVPSSDGEQVWWVEGRPQDGGRFAIVAREADGTDRDVVPTQWNVRSRIHEYGARPWAHAPSVGTVFTFWDDQRLYLMPEGGTEPTALTSAPTDAVTHMYGEPVVAPDRASVWVIRETQRTAGDTKEIERALVCVPLDGSGVDDAVVTTLASGHRFFAYPRPSRDGRRIAYIAWDHPQMPWDGTLLCVADVNDGVGSGARVLAGSTTESVLQPEWADDDHLYAISDRTGWWNLYRLGVDDGTVEALCPREEEFAQPLWVLGYSTYGVLGDGRLAVQHGVGQMSLSVLDPKDGSLTDVGAGLEFGEELQVSGMRVVNEAGSLTSSAAITVVDVATDDIEVVRRSS